MLVKEEWVNQTEGYMVGDSGEYEPYTNDIGALFKEFQKEYGRCISKVYIDKGNIAIGWVFEKKTKYNDCEQYYIQHTWISLYNKKTDVIHKHYYKGI